MAAIEFLHFVAFNQHIVSMQPISRGRLVLHSSQQKPTTSVSADL
jgi:hypothetical protein